MAYLYEEDDVWRHEYKGVTYSFRITDGCSKLSYSGKYYDFVVMVREETDRNETFTVPFHLLLDEIDRAVEMTRKGIEEYVDRKQNG